MITARWLIETRKQLERGRHVLLHGNVRDLVACNGVFRMFNGGLDTTLAELGYTLRAAYNFADGITFSEPDMRARFQALERDPVLNTAPAGGAYHPPASARSGGPPGGGSSGAAGGYRPPGQAAGSSQQSGVGYVPPGAGSGYAPPGVAPTSTPGSTPPRADGAATPQPLYLTDLHLALSAVRSVLSRSQTELVSAVVHFADKLVSGGDSQPEGERRLMVLLNLILSEALRHGGNGPTAGMRNALILVAPVLGQVPVWLYRDNPFIQVISVDRPDAEERRAFIDQRYARFYGAVGETVSPTLVQDFADLTDGLSVWELEAVRLTSFHERLAIQEVRQLVDYFKHGRRDDPWEQLDTRRVQEAPARLAAKVIGQEAAINAVLNVLVSARGGIDLEGAGRRSVRPKGVLFFVGPTGVGKTELAKSVTELVFGDPTAFARYDMSEYSQEHAAERLTGAPPSYVGYEAGGQLTNRMKTRPFSLILFDEIEKAHPRIMDKFLQVLDDGRLTDGQGDTVYFSQSLIIFTSNIGSTRVERLPDGQERVLSAIHKEMDYADLATHYRREVREYFIRMGRPELLGRIGEENVVVFDMLRPQHIPSILAKFLGGLRDSARERFGLELEFAPSVTEQCVRFCSRPENIILGGRGIRNFVGSQLRPPLNRAALNFGRSGGRLRVHHHGEEVSVE